MTIEIFNFLFFVLIVGGFLIREVTRFFSIWKDSVETTREVRANADKETLAMYPNSHTVNDIHWMHVKEGAGLCGLYLLGALLVIAGGVAWFAVVGY